MKSSTIRRSTLSKESMEVIETLAKENQSEDLGEYVRAEEVSETKGEDITNKAQEIDLLWQNFKTTQFSTNSPTAYVLMGFGVGVIVSVICFIFIGLAVTKSGGTMHIGNKALYAPSASVSVTETLDEQVDNIQDEQNSATVAVPSEEDNQAAVEDNTNTSQQSAEPVFDKSKMKKYIVKDGDTGENIIKKHFGSYSPEKADLIMKANNMKSLDRINIDQELWIPVE